MGLFSFLKKKNDAPADDILVMPDTRLRAGEPSRLDSEAERERQRAIARERARKRGVEPAVAESAASVAAFG